MLLQLQRVRSIGARQRRALTDVADNCCTPRTRTRRRAWAAQTRCWPAFVHETILGIAHRNQRTTSRPTSNTTTRTALHPYRLHTLSVTQATRLARCRTHTHAHVGSETTSSHASPVAGCCRCAVCRCAADAPATQSSPYGLYGLTTTSGPPLPELVMGSFAHGPGGLSLIWMAVPLPPKR